MADINYGSPSALDRKAKAKLIQILKTNGYKTYAKILDRFNVFMTEDPKAIAYMLPAKGVIVINRGVDIEQASVLVRHEILHDYLKHEKRLLDHLAKKQGIDRSTYTDIPLKKLDQKLRKTLYQDQMFNYAADYEISNRGYTEKDKDMVRNIKLNGQILRGLVTEDDHPDWVDLSVEEMYDKLNEIREEELKKPVQGFMLDPTTFVDPLTGAVYGAGTFDPQSFGM